MDFKLDGLIQKVFFDPFVGKLVALIVCFIFIYLVSRSTTRILVSKISDTGTRYRTKKMVNFVAFAIGEKDIAASLLSGLIVMFDRSFQVGDRIKFDGIYGDVLSIGVRSTRVRTLDDSLVTVPNS